MLNANASISTLAAGPRPVVWLSYDFVIHSGLSHRAFQLYVFLRLKNGFGQYDFSQDELREALHLGPRVQLNRVEAELCRSGWAVAQRLRNADGRYGGYRIVTQASPVPPAQRSMQVFVV